MASENAREVHKDFQQSTAVLTYQRRFGCARRSDGNDVRIRSALAAALQPSTVSDQQ